MKNCPNCGAQSENYARFCLNCGADLTASDQATQLQRSDDYAKAQEKECLDGFYRFFKFERLMWKIQGILMTICSAIFLALGGLFALGGGLSGDYDALMFFSVYGVLYIVMGILYLPIGIINLRMVKRAEYYMDTLYRDAAPMIKRCRAVGMFVLAGMFNELALIFIIVNFVRAKTNAALLQRILLRQQEFRNNHQQ